MNGFRVASGRRRRQLMWCRILVIAGLLPAVSATAIGGRTPPAKDKAERTSSDPQTIHSKTIATVNGRAIRSDQVDAIARRALDTLKADDELLPWAQAAALQQLINRQLVLSQLEQAGQLATDQDVDLALSRLSAQLARQEKTLDDYCGQLQLTRESLRDRTRWQISWQRCYDRYLTDENLQRYFQQHRREFDGSRIKVAQILWRFDRKQPGDREAKRKEAESVRKRIVAGELKFAEAARRVSQAATAGQGGSLGWIERTGPMPEAFNQVAFALEPREISAPLVSRFGVHLIRCEQVEPGTRTWEQAREPLTKAMQSYLLSWFADRQRERAQIEITPGTPHFRPGTRELEQGTAEGG